MKDDPFMQLVGIALGHVNNSDRLARAIYGLIEGDDPEDAAELIHELGYTDENGEWIYGEDEE